MAIATSTPSSASARRRAPTRSRRRTASWRASTTPTVTRATTRPRSASRRSRAPTTRSPTPRSASSTTPAACSPASAVAALAAEVAASPSDLGDIFSTVFGRRGGPEPVQARGRDLETEVRLSFEQAVHGTELPVVVPKQSTCPTCSGIGRPTRDRAGHLPALRRDRHRLREPGLLLDQPAVPAVRGQRPDHRASLRDLWRLRPDPPAQALPREDPAGSQGRQPDPRRREGRGRAPGRSAGRPVRGHARHPVAGLRAAR